MTPTQQEIIEQLGAAFDRAVEICGREFVAKSLMERFGAGGGEPVAYVCPSSHVTADGSMEDGPDYLEWADEASDYEKRVGTPLYTHPSPTDLQAAYARGLEDAASIVENADTPDCGGWTTCEIAEEIRALKGKK